MKTALILALLLFTAPALAGDLVMREGRDTIILHDTPCVSEALAITIPPQYIAQLQAMSAEVGGQKHAGCWRQVGHAVQLFWDDGDQGLLHINNFKATTDKSTSLHDRSHEISDGVYCPMPGRGAVTVRGEHPRYPTPTCAARTLRERMRGAPLFGFYRI